ncbi:hypothetical protein D3C87_1771120 [compost metagenome]
MSIDAMGGGEHRLLPFPTDPPDGFAQRQTDLAKLAGRLRHFLERRPQRQRRSVHQSQVQIGMSAIAATVDQRRFWRQVGFVDQRVHRQVRQAFGQ